MYFSLLNEVHMYSLLYIFGCGVEDFALVRCLWWPFKRSYIPYHVNQLSGLQVSKNMFKWCFRVISLDFIWVIWNECKSQNFSQKVSNLSLMVEKIKIHVWCRLKSNLRGLIIEKFHCEVMRMSFLVKLMSWSLKIYVFNPYHFTLYCVLHIWTYGVSLYLYLL